MRKYILLLFLCCIILLSCSNSSSQNSSNHSSSAGGKLYIRTFWWAMNNTMEISWIYLGDDGTIVKNPKHGNAPVNIAQEKKDNADYTGTYKISGAQMNITWSTGKKESWLVQKMNGVVTSLNKGPVTIANPLSANFRFDKSFSAASFFEGENLMHYIQFFKDGSCEFQKYSGADAFMADKTKGTYSINKNTIVIQLGGRKGVANIAVLNGAGGSNKLLVINTNYEDVQ